MARDYGSEWSKQGSKVDRLWLVSGGCLFRLDNQEVLFLWNLCEQVGANLENAWDPLPHGVGQSIGMAPNREFPCDLPVPSRGDKFRCWRDETVGRQRPGLFDHTLLSRDIGDTADKQVW